jgi:putative hydroxymethylpyrimidine transporter CytX
MTSTDKLSNRTLFLLWFGAGISMAEIMTGSLYAPMGFGRGIRAILLGHLLGTTFLVLAGIIGFREKSGSMESTRYAFGRRGSYVFSVLNIFQLMGWTAISLLVAGKSLNVVSLRLWGINSIPLWTIVTGLLVVLWLIAGNRGFNIINNIAVVLLLGLTAVMSVTVFKGHAAMPVAGTMSFGQGVELSVIMPLSWLPLVSDYSRMARSEKGSTVATWLGYFMASFWMYIIGMATALAFHVSDPTEILLKAGLGVCAIGIIVMATVTTTFMDVYSSALSFLNMRKGSQKAVSAVMGIVGILLALVFPMERYQYFLDAIGAVFAPLFAILATDYFVFRQNHSNQSINPEALVSWALGVVLYYIILQRSTPLGVTLPDAILTACLFILLHTLRGRATRRYSRKEH